MAVGAGVSASWKPSSKSSKSSSSLPSSKSSKSSPKPSSPSLSCCVSSSSSLSSSSASCSEAAMARGLSEGPSSCNFESVVSGDGLELSTRASLSGQ